MSRGLRVALSMGMVLGMTGLGTAASRDGSKREVTLSLSPSVVLPGGDVRATVRVVPYAENRHLRIAVEATRYSASSERELAGAASPRMFVFWWPSLPEGEYQVTVEVDGGPQRGAECSRSFLVMKGDANNGLGR